MDTVPYARAAVLIPQMFKPQIVLVKKLEEDHHYDLPCSHKTDPEYRIIGGFLSDLIS